MSESINKIIGRLDTIVEEAIRTQSPLGYFPALYRRVTMKVRDGIEHKQFHDNERMEALTINFAGRYVQAYDQLKEGSDPTLSWQVAFEQTDSNSLIVLQHLLLGMNAHISLDLGISTAAVADAANPLAIKQDFMAINEVLGSLIDDTQNRLTRIFGPLGIIDKLLGPTDETLSLFCIEYARDRAWAQAMELMLAGEQQRQDLIRERDHRVANFSKKLIRPPKLSIRLLLKMIRLLERGDVAWRISCLQQPPTTNHQPLTTNHQPKNIARMRRLRMVGGQHE